MIHPSAFAGSLLSLCWHPLFCLLEASHRRRHPTTACTAAHPQCIDLGLIIIFGANLGVIITYNNHWTIDDQTSSYFPTRNYRHRWILGTGFILSRMNVDPWGPSTDHFYLFGVIRASSPPGFIDLAYIITIIHPKLDVSRYILGGSPPVRKRIISCKPRNGLRFLGTYDSWGEPPINLGVHFWMNMEYTPQSWPLMAIYWENDDYDDSPWDLGVPFGTDRSTFSPSSVQDFTPLSRVSDKAWAGQRIHHT